MAQETAQSLIDDILREIYVQANEQDIPAIEFQTCLRYLNRFMAELLAKEIAIPWVELNNPADVVQAPSGAINGIVFNVALRVANQYDVQVSPTLAESARIGMETLTSIGVNFGKQKMPSTLPIGSGNESWLDYSTHFYDNPDEDGVL